MQSSLAVRFRDREKDPKVLIEPLIPTFSFYRLAITIQGTRPDPRESKTD